MTCYLMIDLSEEENAEVLNLAVEAGLSTNDFARRRILGRPLTPAAPSKPSWLAATAPAVPELETKADAAQ